jgi:hypothetical protein
MKLFGGVVCFIVGVVGFWAFVTDHDALWLSLAVVECVVAAVMYRTPRGGAHPHSMSR